MTTYSIIDAPKTRRPLFMRTNGLGAPIIDFNKVEIHAGYHTISISTFVNLRHLPCWKDFHINNCGEVRGDDPPKTLWEVHPHLRLSTNKYNCLVVTFEPQGYSAVEGAISAHFHVGLRLESYTSRGLQCRRNAEPLFTG
ncbi:MAG: hypothetical protein IPG71_10670 [bacterium]|nr:hypothetical protein [bacterium]